MTARVRFTLYAQVGNEEPLPLGFRLIDSADFVKTQVVELLREAADLIEPQALADRKALDILKGVSMKDCTHCGKSPEFCEAKQDAAVKWLQDNANGFAGVTDEARDEIIARHRNLHTCCANCQHIA